MFKKICGTILVLFLAMPLSTFAQEWHTVNQITVVWDAVTAMSNGDLIPATDIIEYKVYLSNTITDPDKTNPAEIGIASDVNYLITLVNEGKYFVGLRTVRKLSNGEVIGESVIGWSDDPAIVTDGKVFGIQHFLLPMVPTGLRTDS
ncbi:hypothetical protein KA005_62620 [bacterium]|nr:hypothetical protein [bacterium]